MKKRKGFKKIVVDGKPFLFTTSGIRLYSTSYMGKIIVYDENDTKYELQIPTRMLYDEMAIGLPEVSLLIKQQILRVEHRDPKKARAFLVRAGILDKSGTKLAKRYR